jgi:predicted protein tyrosine phosphatase
VSDLIKYHKFSREANLQNPHQRQDIHPRVLCVCLGGMLRSPTVAWVLSNPPYDCNARACGTEPTYSPVALDKYLIGWADAIVCADDRTFQEVRPMTNKTVYCLGIPDRYQFREPRLVALVAERLAEVKFPTSLERTAAVDFTANDHTPEALAAAARNYGLLSGKWCDCLEVPAAPVAYFRNSAGFHGWMCSRCRGLLQSG